MNAKLKCFCIGFVAFAVFMTANGCSGVFTDTQTVYTDEEKSYARSQLETAHEEAMELLNNLGGADVRSSESISEENELVGKIISAAWMTTYTNEYDEFIKLLKDNGLYKDAIKITKKYNVKQNERIVNSNNFSSRSINSDFFTNSELRDGDIFLCSALDSAYNSSSAVAAIFIKGEWKHAGLFVSSRRNSQYPIFSASTFTDTSEQRTGNFVGYDNRDMWIVRGRTQARRVRNSTPYQGTAALNYVQQFYGKKFNLLAYRNTDTSWYCSKLVYRAWLSQGYNLEADSGKNQGYHVTPQDLHDDPDTYFLMGDY
ncbi:MAG: YiiX/YebB-like N1pC/P60 family cysteine hydrolase [Treponemataceae bacterium]|nr:YiiX/YebB-like N1pC/P60 family cysteine hydrolase [Spirochaetales bacterium]MDY6031921.1 YiiX/YebB-like N1pC/P60 family cysteine hydrolase [Treponemataceae bacterium]